MVQFQAYEGSISNQKSVEFSGLLDKLETGYELMADVRDPRFVDANWYTLKCTSIVEL